MNCPSCGAPLKLAPGNTSLRCDYCQVMVTVTSDQSGVQLLEEVRDLPCPTCAAPLWHAVLATIELHSCKKCHGLLIPMGAFAALVDKMRGLHEEREFPGPVDEKLIENKIVCPKCRQPMDTHFYLGGGHAIMSTCERDELHWLDGGMLLRIVRMPHVSEE